MYYIDQDNFYRDELDNRPVMVTIRCLTYNHEKFIRQALDGFVMQQTNFRFEAIVHDDCSTDGTVAIIREYAEKYPSIIKPIFEEENQWKKGTIRGIMNSHMRGKYIAPCEGDDYWTDPLKLQKQVDFLEGHPDATMVFHGARVWKENESRFIDEEFGSFKNINNRFFNSNELYQEWVVPTASMLYRTCFQPTFNDRRIMGSDIVIVLNMAKNGKVYGMSDKMSVYRVHEGGVVSRWKSDKINFYKRGVANYEFMEETFPELSRKYLKYMKAINCFKIFSERLFHEKKFDLEYLLKYLKFGPLAPIKYFSKRIFH